MGLKNFVRKVGNKAGDKVAQLSSLSPTQIEDIQLLREEYMLEMPNPNDHTARVETERFMAASSIEIFNSYLSQIKSLYLPIDSDAEFGKEFDAGHNIRYINITKWVTDKKEKNLEKLVNVYAVLSNEDCNIALVFDRKQNTTNVYLAVVNNKNSLNNSDVENYKKQIIEAIRGNFPGAEWKENGIGVLPCFREDKEYSVATASNIPTEKSENFISQTIEKLIDGIVPETNKKEYTIILLATPIMDVEDRKLKLGEYYSGMAPYAAWSTNFQRSENKSVSSSATVGVNVGVSAGVQNGVNQSITDSKSTMENTAKTETASESDSQTENQSITESQNISDSHGENSAISNTKGSGDAVAVGVGVGEKVLPLHINGGYSHNWNRSISETLGETATKTIASGTAKTLGKSTGKTVGNAVANTLGKAVTKSMAATKGIARAANLGGNLGANFARSSTTTVMLGKNEGITQNYTNFNVQHALELLKEQMKRFEQSSALGMWDFAAYVLSEDASVANNVAHSYLALTLGEESYMSKSAINIWRGNVEDQAEQAKEICKYLKMLRHPVFGLDPNVILKIHDNKIEIDNEDNFIVYPPIVTATTSLSGKELAYSLNFPQKSIAGLPVFECVGFGRNVVTYENLKDDEKTIELGNIFHMNHEENTPVSLSLKSLASHTFVTGSTGSGKSNAIYDILENARKQDVKFLVVEPAKGEYKNVFGGRDDVTVFGTNPLLSTVLRINPFSFPESIHVLEHIDRLVEIFNVCWPMYAAMPAVLKNAVEKSYVDCGWDMITSKNKYDVNLYPTFEDVSNNIKEIIDSSEYDTDNKGAYKGSLLTRLKSLCNGINGIIFSANEIAEEELFEKNVIVDLSRVGSTETKSLIMGMMVLKLQEYRMSSATTMNADLKHLTVLEEAHNLLRRTSNEQNSEGNNLLSKSVEMLSNAIAEMRTYGEGFIIADQAPELMDMSVIRNTNTKIILRLPDYSDRELVGKASNLNEDQITELAKMPCGVAAVYQNEWIQPVLCKVKYYDTEKQSYEMHPDESIMNDHHEKDIEQSLLDLIMKRVMCENDDKSNIDVLKSRLIYSQLKTIVKKDFLDFIHSNSENNFETLRTLVYDFFSAGNAIEESKNENDIQEWARSVVEKLQPSLNSYSKNDADLILALILYEQALRDRTYESVFNRFTEVYMDQRGVH